MKFRQFSNQCMPLTFCKAFCKKVVLHDETPQCRSMQFVGTFAKTSHSRFATFFVGPPSGLASNGTDDCCRQWPTGPCQRSGSGACASRPVPKLGCSPLCLSWLRLALSCRACRRVLRPGPEPLLSKFYVLLTEERQQSNHLTLQTC